MPTTVYLALSLRAEQEPFVDIDAAIASEILYVQRDLIHLTAPIGILKNHPQAEYHLQIKRSGTTHLAQMKTAMCRDCFSVTPTDDLPEMAPLETLWDRITHHARCPAAKLLRRDGVAVKMLEEKKADGGG